MAKFVPFALNSGKYNMDFDAYLLEESVRNSLKEPVLRLYGWEPSSVSLGRNQQATAVNSEFCSSNNIDIVRRLTGGRALLHENEITYSIVLPSAFLKNGESVLLSYKEISGALIEGFKSLGIELAFPQRKTVSAKYDYCMSLSTGADLSFKGRKIIGSAQFRKKGYILQHGSILWDYNAEKIEKIFNEKPETSKISTLKEINSEITPYEICDALKNGFSRYFSVHF